MTEHEAIKSAVDKAKAGMDKARRAVDKVVGIADGLNARLGFLPRLVPGVGEVLTLGLAVADGVRTLFDVADGIVDALDATVNGVQAPAGVSPLAAIEAAAK